MPNTENDIALLLLKHIRKELSAEERVILDTWAAESDANKKLLQEVEDKKKLSEDLKEFEYLFNVNSEPSLSGFKKTLPKKTVRMTSRSNWFRYVASIAAVLVLALGLVLWNGSWNDKEDILTATQEQRFKNEVPAATDGAVLTLADGTQIVLDDKNGALASQGGMQLLKEEGTLNYRRIGESSMREITFNSVATPRGKYISLRLSDGSKVWLNAASSIKYPVEFLGKERKVQVTGEAFFEVAGNANRPFIVEVNGMQVEVTGTQFNVCAYENDSEMKTTLVEGSVNVKMSNSMLTLSPGQQAVVKTKTVAKEPVISLRKEVDVQEQIAWREGIFHYVDAPIEEIMKQLSRWYNVEVEFKTNPDKHYYFTIARNEPLSKLLSIMEKAGNVRFVIDGRDILVIP